MTVSTLLFNGKPMSASPKGTTLNAIAVALLAGQAVSAELEPGDATYYNLLIVPCWSEGLRNRLGRFGIPAGSATNYLYVQQLRDLAVEAEGFFARQGGVSAVDVPNRNEWSRQLIAWWVNLLWEELGSQARVIPARDPLGQLLNTTAESLRGSLELNLGTAAEEVIIENVVMTLLNNVKAPRLRDHVLKAHRALGGL